MRHLTRDYARPIGAAHEHRQRLAHVPRAGDELPGNAERFCGSGQFPVGAVERLRPADEIKAGRPPPCLLQQVGELVAPVSDRRIERRAGLRRKHDESHRRAGDGADERLLETQFQKLRRQNAEEAVGEREDDRDEESHGRVGDREEIEGQKDAGRPQGQDYIDGPADRACRRKSDDDARQCAGRPLQGLHCSVAAGARIGEDEEGSENRPEPALA